VPAVVVYGSVNWDEIYQLQRYPQEHEKVNADDRCNAIGGAAANTSTWLAGRGVSVELVGALGNDAEGRLCLASLRAAGVGSGLVEVLPGVPTGRASSWVADTDKRIVRHRDSRLTRGHERPETLTAVAGSRHLHVASHLDGAGMECARAAVEAGVSISVELSGHRHDELRALADVVFVNAEELAADFGLDAGELTPDDAAGVASRPGALLVVTAGAEGIYCAWSERVERIPVQPVAAVVDRTGAGDAFDGGFLAAWLNGATPVTAVATGHELSRQALAQAGASWRPA
jgi:ribokinase